MGDEKTQVETTELRTWARGARDRSDRVSQAADDAGRTRLDSRVFGAINSSFGLDFGDKIQKVLGDIRDTAGYLANDADGAVAVADGFDQVDEAQANRFRRTDGPG